MSQTAAMCARCGTQLASPDDLACARCGALVHGEALTHWAAEARWQAQYNPAKAISIWEECLKHLPPDSRQHAAVQSEIDQLRAAPPAQLIVEEPGSLPTVRQENLRMAMLKTGLSMALSIVVYQFSFGWMWALGFVILILVHELGHVVANVRYGIRASPPIFIPYLGAVINLRQNPPNARVEAIIGIAGPIAGTLASIAMYGLYALTGNPLALTLAWFGFTMNLFNLLPVPPLDGGRVTAGVSPWFWVAGLAGMGWMLYGEIRSKTGPGVLLLILIFALPRVIKTLKSKGRSGRYYAIGKVAPVVIGMSYLALVGVLIALCWYSGRQFPNGTPF